MSVQIHPPDLHYITRTDTIAPLSAGATLRLIGGFNVMNSAGTVVASIDNTGVLTANSASAINGVTITQTATGVPGADANNSFVVSRGASRIAETPTTTIIGYAAGAGPVTGAQNTLVGVSAGAGTTTGTSNTCVGYQSGTFNVTGASNTFVGYQAGRGNVDVGGSNTAVGGGALAGIGAAANSNTAVGMFSGGNMTTGIQNALIGMNSGGSISVGNGNTCLGFAATAGANYGIAIGNGATVDAAATNHGIAIGRNATVNGDHGVAIGLGAIAPANTMSIGTTTAATRLIVQENAPEHIYYTTLPVPSVLEGTLLTPADVLSGIVHITGAGGSTALMPDPALLVAAIPGCAVGHTIKFVIYNEALNNTTITGFGALPVYASNPIITLGCAFVLIVITNIGVGTQAYNTYAVMN